jgi:GNAT superfamily N-acetyltransferase
MRFRLATPEDAVLLAPLNAQLIREEGHRNTMTVPQLAERMKQWLDSDYQAAVFEDSDRLSGYALYRREPEFVYLRQLFVRADCRRRGIGREAIDWLRRNAWEPTARVRIDVLVGNAAGQAFWRAVGFRDYCITMELNSRAVP